MFSTLKTQIHFCESFIYRATWSSLEIVLMTSSTGSNKRIAKNTILLYFRSIFILLISLYTSRVTLEVLGVEDYGIYQIVGGVVAMFSMLSATLASASQRFITFTLGENDYQKQRRVFSTCISLHIVLGIIVVVLLEVLGLWFLYNKLNIPVERLQAAGWVMHFSIATFFISVVSVPYNAVIIAHEKMSAFAYISILEGLLKLGVVILLMHIQWDKLYLYAVLHFCVAVSLRVIYSMYSSSHFDEAKNVRLYIDKTLFKGMFAFAGWNMIGSSALVLRNQGIDILLNLSFGVTVNAAKGICNQVQAAVTQLVGNFTMAVKPQLVQSVARKDLGRTYSLVHKGSKMAFMLMMLMALPIIVCCDDILAIWLVNVPKYTILMVQITFIYLLFTTLSRFLIDCVLAYGEIKWLQIIDGGTKLLAIPITWITIKVTDSPYSGVVVISVIQFICVFEELYFANKYISLDWKEYLVHVVMRCWLSFILSFTTVHLLLQVLSLPIVCELIIALLVSLLFIYWIGLDRKEKEMSKAVIKYIKKR